MKLIKLIRDGGSAYKSLIKSVSPGKASKIRYLGLPLENAELARSEYHDGKTVLESLPSVVTFALTTFCNNKLPCVICDRHTRPESADSEVNRFVIEAARPLLQTAKYVLPHCGGEAMLSKHFDKVIAMINPPTRVSFATNAMLLTEKRADLMLEKDIMANFVVSMDASTPETYRIMRPSCDFETVTKNIEYYTRKARSLKRASHSILNMTLCEANLKDVPALVDLAVKIGTLGVQYAHLNTGLDHVVTTADGWEWDYKEQAKFKDKALHDEMILEAYKRAGRHGIKIDFVGKTFIGPDADKNTAIVESQYGEVVFKVFNWNLEDMETSTHHKLFAPGIPSCAKPWQEVNIQPLGNVRLCCFHDESKYTIGNIIKTDFMKIWNSEIMIRQREEFLADAVSGICKKSQPCMHRGRQ